MTDFDSNSATGRRPHRRPRKSSRVAYKPQVVISEQKEPELAMAPVTQLGIEPSREKPRQEYEPTDENCLAVEECCVDILEATDLDYEVDFEHGDFHRVHIKLPPRAAGALIGRRGSSIEALELILGRMASQRAGTMIPIQLDVNEYRQKQEEELRQDALHFAQQVLESGRDYHFPAMSGRDRRVIHIAVKAIEGLDTFTLGEGASRHVVIAKVGGVSSPNEA
jgi:spoIIIJ-associated protein